ncbi:MAG: ParB N-terminal domain-containing protein [Magnetovibrio sp.]|nr:ParB N-terminal domain-containing protein [Magnetovibrio sp.]
MNELAKSLTQTYEGLSGSANDKLKVVDPVVETPMVLNIEQIELYENNPRTFKNPKYDDIKASINAEGLKQPLCVTRRPGDSKYFVEAGGNTRLSILWELFEETSDYKYANISVIFRPWKDDSNIMVSHLIENELRGEMFDDRGAVKGGKSRPNPPSNRENFMNKTARISKCTRY